MQTHTFQKSITLINEDSLVYLKTLPDNSVDLVLTDPPYFQVKKEAWDNQWDNESHFLAWLDEILMQCWRVLKPNGSLYLFCASKLAAETELLVKARFNVLNHIVWTKPSGIWNRADKSKLRSFFPATERVIFAEHYGSQGYAKGNSGYASKCNELKAEVFKPLIDYFSNARTALGVTAKEINKATGTQMCSHWFSASQWKLPNERQYLQLQQLFKQKGIALMKEHQELKQEYAELHQTYQQLVKSYDDLKQEHELLRRPFTVSKDVPFTDVWEFGSVQYYQGKHPCEKPADLLAHIIASSSREGHVILDPFMGSGSTGKVAYQLGRQFIGIELEEERYQQTCEEFESLATV